MFGGTLKSSALCWARLAASTVSLEATTAQKSVPPMRKVNEFQDLYTMGSIMQEFYATSIPRSKCENILTPYYVAAWNGNLDHLEFLWPHFKVSSNENC